MRMREEVSVCAAGVPEDMSGAHRAHCKQAKATHMQFWGTSLALLAWQKLHMPSQLSAASTFGESRHAPATLVVLVDELDHDVRHEPGSLIKQVLRPVLQLLQLCRTERIVFLRAGLAVLALSPPALLLPLCLLSRTAPCRS